MVVCTHAVFGLLPSCILGSHTVTAMDPAVPLDVESKVPVSSRAVPDSGEQADDSDRADDEDDSDATQVYSLSGRPVGADDNCRDDDSVTTEPYSLSGRPIGDGLHDVPADATELTEADAVESHLESHLRAMEAHQRFYGEANVESDIPFVAFATWCWKCCNVRVRVVVDIPRHHQLCSFCSRSRNETSRVTAPEYNSDAPLEDCPSPERTQIGDCDDAYRLLVLAEYPEGELDGPDVTARLAEARFAEEHESYAADQMAYLVSLSQEVKSCHAVQQTHHALQVQRGWAARRRFYVSLCEIGLKWRKQRELLEEVERLGRPMSQSLKRSISSISSSIISSSSSSSSSSKMR